MEVFQKYTEDRFMSIVPGIKENTNEWWCIDVALTGKTGHNSAYIALKLRQYFDAKTGVIFICNKKNVLVLVHLGRKINKELLLDDINTNLPYQSCDFKVTDITPDGLIKIQLNLRTFEQDNKSSHGSADLQERRSHRKEKVVMLVDDDSLVRNLVSKTFQKHCKILEFKDAQGVLEAYLRFLPDVVFLDIHMPGESGMSVLGEILRFDESAYVIILSSDSVKVNILQAKNIGARDFVAKPFTLDKLLFSYMRCPTVSKKISQ